MPHVVEPTTPITGCYIQVLHYVSPKLFVPPGTTFDEPFEFPFIGALVQVYIDSDRIIPSEHFRARLREERAIVGPGGQMQGWEKQWAIDWKHANVPPHTNLTPDTAPGFGGMWHATGDFSNTWYREPGIYRHTLRVIGDESGGDFTSESFVRVPEGTTAP